MRCRDNQIPTVVRRLSIAAVLTLCLSLAPAIVPPAFAQADTEEITRALRDIHVDLDDASRDLADEYLDILSELDQIIQDYREYFDELPQSLRDAHPVSFKRFEDGLHSDKYVDDPRLLQRDVRSFIRKLEVLESDHRKSSGDEAPRCCRMIRNLRREMLMLNDHIAEYLSARTEQQLKLVKIKRYLEIELPRLLAEAMASYDEQAQILARLNEKLADTDAAISEPTAPAAPEIVARVKWRTKKPAVPERSGTTFTYADSLHVTDRTRQIVVTNPAGDIRITGWSRSTIHAELTIEVEAGTHGGEESFSHEAALKVRSEGNRYAVSARYPEQSSQRGHLLRSALVVRLPNTNPVSTESGFGQVSVSDLFTTVQVTGHHADIDLDNLKGSVAVTNNQGSIHLARIKGAVSVSQINGEVRAADCEGAVSIANTSGSVYLTDSRGQATVAGSGTAITAEGFQGPLTVQNSYGMVEVRNVEGALSVTNAYDALRIRNIRGAVKASNTYGSITAYRVTGPLSITNSDGSILVESFSGPLELENEGAPIQLVIDDKLAGTSRVFNDNGDITVELLHRDDFILTAQTVGGSIKSRFPLQMTRQGDRQSAVLGFGRATDSLVLSGRSSLISITDSD